MAEVTVNSIQRGVQGNKRIITANIDIAADTDTMITGLTNIDAWHCRSVTNNAIGGTDSAGTITFQTGGAESAAVVSIEGT